MVNADIRNGISKCRIISQENYMSILDAMKAAGSVMSAAMKAAKKFK